MASVPFHYVDLRTFCYATEDEKRVEQALRLFLPDEGDRADGDDDADGGGRGGDEGGGTGIERAETEGFHGDRIVVLSARIETADEMRYVLGKLSTLPDLDRVLTELDERVDEDCSLFLRLDKQAAFNGEVRLGEGITLRAKVEAYPAKQPAAVENAREALAALRDE